MASISEIIAQQLAASKQVRSPTGQLSQESPAGIQSLSGALGLSVPPTTPLMTMQAGGNLDQAKMAGSPAQVQSAISYANQPEQSLAVTQRRAQPAPAQAPAAAAYKQQITDLSGLSDTGRRVAQYIDIQKQKLAATKLAPQQVLDEPALKQLPVVQQVSQPINYSQLKSDLATLLSNPGDTATMARVNQMLGKSAGQLLTPEELKQFYQEATDAITSGIAGSIDTDITVSDLATLPEFGMDLNQVASALGMTPEEVGKLNLKQLQDKVAQVEQNITANQQAQATGTILGGAERAAYRDLGRELAVSGVTSAEAELGRIEQALSEGQSIRFAGQEYSLEELLGEGGITEVVSDYLNAPEGDPTRTNLEKSEPDLVKFIKANQLALEGLVADLGTAATGLQATQAANAKLATAGNITLDDVILKSVIPNWGDIQTGAIDRNSIALMQALDSLPPADQTQLGTTLNAIAQQYPELLSELPNLGKSDILRLMDPAVLQALETNQQLAKRLAGIDPSDTNQVLDTYLGRDVDPATVARELEADKARKALGLPTSNLSSLLDRDGDGKLDSGESLLQTMRNATTKATLSELLSGKAKTYQATPTQNTQLTENEVTLSQLLPAASDGVITADEVRGLNLTEDQAKAIQPLLLNAPGAAVGVDKLLRGIIRDAADNRANTVLSGGDYNPVQIPPLGTQEASLDGYTKLATQVQDKLTALQVASKGSDHLMLKYRLSTLQGQLDQLNKLIREEQEIAGEVDYTYIPPPPVTHKVISGRGAIGKSNRKKK